VVCDTAASLWLSPLPIRCTTTGRPLPASPPTDLHVAYPKVPTYPSTYLLTHQGTFLSGSLIQRTGTKIPVSARDDCSTSGAHTQNNPAARPCHQTAPLRVGLYCTYLKPGRRLAANIQPLRSNLFIFIFYFFIFFFPYFTSYFLFSLLQSAPTSHLHVSCTDRLAVLAVNLGVNQRPTGWIISCLSPIYPRRCGPVGPVGLDAAAHR